MILLNAKIRKETGKKVDVLRKAGKIPAVVYGPGEKNVSLEIDEKEFNKVFKLAGESSLIELLIHGDDKPDKSPKGHFDGPATMSPKATLGGKPVLIHDIQIDPITGLAMHVDFFQASLKEEVQVKVPLVFEGTSLAVKDLGGTLVKNIAELEIKALPQNLPHEIKVSIDRLNSFSDHILVKDIKLPEGVKAVQNPDEIAVMVSAPEKVEEELAKAIEEKVEDVEKVEKEKKAEEVVEEQKE